MAPRRESFHHLQFPPGGFSFSQRMRSVTCCAQGGKALRGTQLSFAFWTVRWFASPLRAAVVRSGTSAGPEFGISAAVRGFMA
jgi:hypothetical protein